MILFVAMGRGTTRRSPSDLTPSFLGIPNYSIRFASLSTILFAIKKRIFAKYQPLNLCSLTKPSPSPGAPQISAQQEPTPPRVSPASPSTAGRSKAPAAARHAQRPGDGEEAPAGEEAPSTPPTGPETPPQPSNQETAQPTPAARPDPPAADRLPGAAAPAPSSRRDRETETERGKREGATASRTASAPQHIAPEPVTQQEHPSPSRRLEKLTPAAVPESLPELPAPPPFQFCFWRENRTGAPKPRRNTEERRPPADAAHQRKGEPLHFGLQRLSQISTQYHHHHTLTPKISSVTRSV